MKRVAIFSHGKESGPWGRKISQLAKTAKDFGFSVTSPDYRDLDNPDERVQRLLDQPEAKHEENRLLILVGSSMGGYVSTVASNELNPHGLFLLAPAFGMPGYEKQYPSPGTKNVFIVAGWQDEVIPVDNMLNFAREHKSNMHILDGDHRLTANIEQIQCQFRKFLQNTIQQFA